jgi:UDP-N-acetylglucosamine 2-epimerase (non-hydrolysing)
METRLVHTGQHYDAALSDVFFRDLGLPEPDAHLNVGSGAHGEQTARTLRAFLADLRSLAAPPAGIVVVGDVNSTLACTVAGRVCGIPVAHVEAGLRSRDRTMPEEVNRLAVDALADLLLVSEPAGVENLREERVPEERVHLVGNCMIDSLVAALPAARASGARARLAPGGGRYLLATLHRPANVDTLERLSALLEFLGAAAQRLPLVFPVHPRTAASLDRHGLRARLDSLPGLRPVPPAAYLEMVDLMEGAAAIVTDSGGIQEETTFLGVPCLTLRENTERPITVEKGTNTLHGSDTRSALARLDEVLRTPRQPAPRIDLWDGAAGERVAEVLARSWG